MDYGLICGLVLWRTTSPPPKLELELEIYEWICKCTYACRRSKPGVGILTANDTDPPPVPNPPSVPIHEGKTWPTPNGINEAEARNICQDPIILQSEKIYSICHNYTAVSLEYITDSCMTDLLVCKPSPVSLVSRISSRLTVGTAAWITHTNCSCE